MGIESHFFWYNARNDKESIMVMKLTALKVNALECNLDRHLGSLPAIKRAGVFEPTSNKYSLK
jgi:hypothetical protein